MEKTFKYLGISLIVLMFVAPIIYLSTKSKKRFEIYSTTNAVITNIVKKTIVTGSVIPRKEVQIVPQVSGIIENIYVEAGQEVKKGDLIAKIKIIPNMLQLSEAESRFEKAKLMLEDIQRKFDQQEVLFNKKVIPENDYFQSKVSLENAKVERNVAENNLQLIKEGVAKDAMVATNTLIRSTITGTILDVPVKEGNSVIETNTFNAGTTIAIVADLNDMIFKGNIDETEIGKISKGMPIKLIVGAIEGVKYDAIIDYISPKGIENNGTILFEIRAKVKLANKFFMRAGYSTNAEIEMERKDNVLAINESLLQYDNDSTFVEIEIGPQNFRRNYLKVGISDGVKIEILRGLKLEDKIKISSK